MIGLPKLVVASSKDFSHRIHIAEGVYGDVQLRFIDGHFVPLEWTYPDYQTGDAMTFFEAVRTRYFEELRKR